MAGEWIKMRTNLWDDPRVSQICDMTGAQEATVIGALYWLWASADEHTEDGFMPGLSKAGIDRKTGIKGFGEALASIHWIKDGEAGITICKFSDHNGASAKRRASDAQRKANSRSLSASDADNSGTDCRQDAPDCGAREEKIREDIKQPLKSKAEATNGSRLPTDWTPSEKEIEFCQTNRPDLIPSQVADKFRDFWISATGKGATKRDWSAAWRNWVRNEKSIPASRASPVKPSTHVGFDNIDYRAGVNHDGSF